MPVTGGSAVYLDGPWSHRSVSANGSRFHIAESGEGPLVLMLVMLCFALAYGLQTVGVWDWASFLIVAGVLVVLAAAFAGIIYLKVRRLDRLRKTRESVQGDIAMLRRDEQASPPATAQR